MRTSLQVLILSLVKVLLAIVALPVIAIITIVILINNRFKFFKWASLGKLLLRFYSQKVSPKKQTSNPPPSRIAPDPITDVTFSKKSSEQ